MLWKYTSQPAAEPVTYAQAKQQCYLDDDTLQSLITTYITAARLHGENLTGKTWVQRNVQAQYYESRQRYDLPRGPVQSITSIVDGTGATVDPSTYQLRRIGNTDFVFFTASAPSIGNDSYVQITYVAGYGDYTTVPADLCIAVLLHVGQLYLNREAGTPQAQNPVIGGLDAIYDQYRATELCG